MKDWLKQRSTQMALATIILGVLSVLFPPAVPYAAAAITAFGLRANDVGVVNRQKKNTGLGTSILLLAFLVIGCGGAFGQFADAHQDDIEDLEQCGIQCGVDLAADALSCPINGGSIEDVIDARGLAEGAAQCVLSCMTNKAVDVFSEVCSEKNPT